MSEIQFSFLDKRSFDSYAAGLFTILYGNMEKIAPTGDSYEAGFAIWSKTYGSAFINRAERKIVLITGCDSQLLGFFGYLTEGNTFYMEEIQFVPRIHGMQNIFRALYGFVLQNLPRNLAFVEAHAHKSNQKSIGILRHLGLKITGKPRMGFHGVFGVIFRIYWRGTEAKIYNL